MKAMPMPQALRDRILSVIQRAEAETEAAAESLMSGVAALAARKEGGKNGTKSAVKNGATHAGGIWSAYKTKLAEARKREKRLFAPHSQLQSQSQLQQPSLSSTPGSPSSRKGDKAQRQRQQQQQQQVWNT